MGMEQLESVDKYFSLMTRINLVRTEKMSIREVCLVQLLWRQVIFTCLHATVRVF